MARGVAEPLDDLTRRRRLNQGCCPLHNSTMYVHAYDDCMVLDVRCRNVGCAEKAKIRPDDKRYRLFVEPRQRRPGGVA